MSTPLLAFDPAVPHRDRLLDANVMREPLSLVGGDAVWTVAKVKYHPGRDLRVLYRGGAAADHRLIVARTLRPHSGETRFHGFPRDRRLPRLADLMAPAAELRPLVDGAWTASRLAGYAPEKSAVVACLNGDPQRPLAYAKLFAYPQEARAAFAIATAVSEGLSERAAVCRIPRPLLFAAAENLLFLEPAHGRRLTDLEDDELIAAAGSLGAALAELHDSRIDLPSRSGGRTADDHLEHAASLIAMSRPELAPAVTALARRLIASRPRLSSMVPLHGDVHLKNALIDDARVSLIDFDQAHAGPAAADIGSFLAALRADALTGASTQGRVAAVATMFLRGYADVRALPPASELGWHTAAALLAERAQRGITRLRADVLAGLSSLLDEAARHLRRSAA